MTYKRFISWFIKKLQRNDNAINSGKREPLDHPTLSRMTLTQLADLPMPSYVKENCTGSIRII
jgi:hypothetical protein